MSKPTDFFSYDRNGILSADGVSLIHIAESVGTPTYVYSTRGFLEPLKALQKGLSGIDHLICFAVKSNSNLSILKMLAEQGAGMDLVSGGELFRAAAAGVRPERLIFSGVGKTPGEMARALQYGDRGIYSFNIESEGELAILSWVASQMERRAPVALRFNPDVDAKTHPYISTGLKKNKFGLNRQEILKIVHNLSEYPGIELKGLSIHIGSQLLSLSPLNDAFGKAKKLIEEIEPHLPEPLSFVDLGGGLGIGYKNERPPSIEKYCALIQRHFGKRSKRPLKVLIEPGRSISGNAGVLLTEVLYRKDRKDKTFLILDSAMNDLMRPSLYGSYHEILPVVRKKGPKKKMDVVGPVCETGDCFAVDRPMPRDLQPGDLMAILSAGAYGMSMAGNYNSRPRPTEVLLDDGRFEIIRDRETYEDLIRGEVDPGRIDTQYSLTP